MSGEPHLYMWSGAREGILERHDFFVDETNKRILQQFDDVSAQAESFAMSEYERLASLPYSGDDMGDLGAVADTARERGLAYYSLLSDLAKQTMLGALAGLYHQWDKELRRFLDGELSHYYVQADVAKWVWMPDGPFEILEAFGLDFRSATFYARLDACRLVVNVYKHGKGRSMDLLRTTYPEYLPTGLGHTPSSFSIVRYDMLSVSQKQFDAFGTAIRESWEYFPERSYLKDHIA